MYGYAHCKYCGKRFSLRYKKRFLGKSRPDNFVIVSEADESPVYVHKTCFTQFLRAKRKTKKFRIVGGLDTGVVSLKGEYEFS